MTPTPIPTQTGADAPPQPGTARPAAAPALVEADAVALCDAWIHHRQHIGPKNLAEPGPDEATLRAILSAGAAAPDHRQLRPWRFLVLGPAARDKLSQVFAEALQARDPLATPQQLDEARDKALRGPVLLMAIADLRADAPEVAPAERLVSLGCVIQNILLAAQARGFGSGLSSGRAMDSAAMRVAFDLAAGEQAVCFITLGTPRRARPMRLRPAVDDFVRWV
jgi:nitroreductase